MIEKLADLEHEQWAHWTRYMLDNLTEENIARWRRQCDTPYSELTEREKDSDREWARRITDLILEDGAVLVDELVARDDMLSARAAILIGIHRMYLQNLIRAWESLPEGRHSPGAFQRWLLDEMRPALDEARGLVRHGD